MIESSLPDGQIILPFAWFERLDFELYVTRNNLETIASLKRVATGAGIRNHYLWGQPGTGKSHLLQAACTLASDSGRTAAYIPLRQHGELSPGMLAGLGDLDLVCIDDLDDIQGQADWERALFVLFNEMRDKQRPLLFSATTSPKGNEISMPDLKSRLAWDLVYHLAPIDEASLITALQLRAHARQFDFPDDVVEFLVKRLSRDTHTLFQLLNQLDTASLQSQKKLTIPFVKSVLGLK
ncbi:MAG: DnaA regulatory inactivator Hda [Gammaproteobacteria bacterium]|nr:DnaA regulatory inactivator Hda [Gammaproteobacteria bacterium]